MSEKGQALAGCEGLRKKPPGVELLEDAYHVYPGEEEALCPDYIRPYEKRPDPLLCGLEENL
jgi:hypothetical protein